MANDMIISGIVSYCRLIDKLNLKTLNKTTNSNFLINSEIYEYYKKELNLMFRNIILYMEKSNVSNETVNIYLDSISELDKCSYGGPILLTDIIVSNIRNICYYFEFISNDDEYGSNIINEICKKIIKAKIPKIFGNYKIQIQKIKEHYCRNSLTNVYKKNIILICIIYIFYTAISFFSILLILLIVQKEAPSFIMYMFIIPLLWIFMFALHATKTYISYRWKKNKILYYLYLDDSHIYNIEYIFTIVDIIISLPHIMPIIAMMAILNDKQIYSYVIPEFLYYYYRSFEIMSMKKIYI